MAKINEVATPPSPPTENRRRSISLGRWREYGQTYGTLVALIVLIVINVIITPHFLSPNTINTNLYQVAETMIVAMGMTLVIATGGIDLSVGSVMAIAGVLAALMLRDNSLHIGTGFGASLLIIVIAVLIAGLFGLFNGLLVTIFRIQPIVATLILFIAGRGFASAMANGFVNFSDPLFSYIGTGTVIGIPFQAIVMLIISIIFMWLVRTTVFGRAVVATGGNEPAARLAGISVARVKLTVYIIIGLLSGLAGVFYVANNNSAEAPGIGLGMELNAIAAVAVGGSSFTGGQANVIGTFIGALFIQLLNATLIANNVSADIARVVEALVIILAVYLQTQRKSA